jgi:hyaluronan synthase
MTKRTTHVKTRPYVTLGLFALIGIAGAAWFAWRDTWAFGLYGLAVATILGLKLGLSLLPAQTWPLRDGGMDYLRVCAVVPIYNEDPAILRQTLDSIASQTRPVQHVSNCR